MASKVKKVCVSLPEESLAQLEWLRKNVLHAPESASFSGLLQMAVGLAYFKYNAELNERCMEDRFIDV